MPSQYNPDQHHRRSIRLQGYDYASAGSYFITICTHQRECLFGEIIDGQMMLNELGQIAADYWQAIPDHFPQIRLDAFVVMPNHIHGILVMIDDRSHANTHPQRSNSGKGIANSGFNSRTQLDIKLTDGSFDSHNTIMSLRSNGNVGIGTTSPGGKLEVNGNVSLSGYMMERLNLIQCNRRGDWGSRTHPIKVYFLEKLRGNPIGTMMTAIQDHPDWRGHYWQGWVDADGRIRVIHNQINTSQIADQNQ